MRAGERNGALNAAVPASGTGETSHAAAHASSPRRLRLAYLTNQYPAVSHTFIRRELQAIERRGHYVVRLSVRESVSAIVDEEDQKEKQRTIVALKQSPVALLGAVAWVMLNRPSTLFKGMLHSLARWWSSNRSPMKRLAYFVEACYILRVCVREGIEHIHVHFGTNAAAVAKIVRRMGGPTYSVTYHGSIEWDEPQQYDVGGTMGESLFGVGISHYTTSQIRRWTPVQHWDRIHVVRCGVGENYARQTPPPLDPASRSIVAIGRLSPEKGFLLLIQAFEKALQQLGEERARAKLIIVGDGPQRGDLERMVAQFGIGGQVVFAGFQSEKEVRRLIGESRALALCSFSEGLPVVLMESLALERPVIAAAISGIPELVRGGESGWLVPAGDVEGMANAIREALTVPPEEIQRLGRAGRAIVLRQHNSDLEAAKLEALLLRYIAKIEAQAAEVSANAARADSGGPVEQPVRK